MMKMRSPQYRPAVISLLLGTLPIGVKATCLTEKCCHTNPPHALRHDAQLRCPLPFDDSIGSQPVDFSPWTHRPTCVNAGEDPSQKYCVYSNSRHGSQGLSIITTPKTAADTANMLNEEFPGGHELNTTDQSYAIVAIPPKGKGVIATRKIRRAEAFMTDWASVLLDLSFPKAVQQQVGHKLLHVATEQLSDPDRVLGLGRSSTQAKDIVEDILGTNAFSFTLGGDPHMALYPEVAVSSYRPVQK